MIIRFLIVEWLAITILQFTHSMLIGILIDYLSFLGFLNFQSVATPALQLRGGDR